MGSGGAAPRLSTKERGLNLRGSVGNKAFWPAATGAGNLGRGGKGFRSLRRHSKEHEGEESNPIDGTSPDVASVPSCAARPPCHA